MSVLEIVEGSEVRRLEWDPKKKAEVARVEEEFNKIVGSMLTYKEPKGGGGVKEHTKEFDPEAERIVATHPLVGG